MSACQVEKVDGGFTKAMGSSGALNDKTAWRYVMCVPPALPELIAQPRPLAVNYRRTIGRTTFSSVQFISVLFCDHLYSNFSSADFSYANFSSANFSSACE